jgi:hypothetical protein
MKPSCGKISAEKTRRGNLSLGMHGDWTICRSKRQRRGPLSDALPIASSSSAHGRRRLTVSQTARRDGIRGAQGHQSYTSSPSRGRTNRHAMTNAHRSGQRRAVHQNLRTSCRSPLQSFAPRPSRTHDGLSSAKPSKRRGFHDRHTTFAEE